MDDSYYEVLYNTCYGGFGFPEEFTLKMFELYPPHTDVGKKLFKDCSSYTTFYQKNDTLDNNKGGYHIITKTTPMQNEYHRLWTIVVWPNSPGSGPSKEDETNFVTRDFKSYYYITDSESWRKIPEVIELAKQESLIGNKIGYSKLKIARVPTCCRFTIREYDGMEGVDIEIPYMKIIDELLNYVKTQDATKLGEIPLYLIEKNMTIHEFANKCYAFDDTESPDMY